MQVQMQAQQLQAQMHNQIQAQQLTSDMMHPGAIMHAIQPIPATMHGGMPPAPSAPQPRRANHAGHCMQDIAADIHGIPPA
jgi:TolA-binding protein